jgi:putative DNA primase/helicase
MNDLDRVRDALAYIPAHDRETWVRMGMAIKNEFGDAGFDVWDEWSQSADNYSPAAARSVWKGLK